jgi:hypothetical protein
MPELRPGDSPGMRGLIVNGDNHFVVRGPRPDRETVCALVKHWSIIEIGQTTPVRLQQWTISTKEFREDLEWAWIVPANTAHTAAVMILLDELKARGVPIEVA